MTGPAKLSLAVVLLALVAGGAPAASGADPARDGRWSSPFWEGGATAFDPPSAELSKRYPTAATAIVLPDGRLLYWNGIEGSENGQVWLASSDGKIVVENSRVRILDLRSPSPRWTTSELERGTTADAEAGFATRDLFCSDQKLLYTGHVLVAGGTRWDVPEDTRIPEPRGIAATSIFDPARDRFDSVADMREPRWYPSLVTLRDGRVVVASGVRRVLGTVLSPEPSNGQVRLTEIFDPVTQRWADGGTSEWSFPLYPRLHLLPDGKVFYGGAGQSWDPGGTTIDHATWGQRRVYDPSARRWSTAGLARSGVRSGAASVMLRLEPPYDSADILTAGGTQGLLTGAYAATTLSEVVRWTPAGIKTVGSPRLPIAGIAGDATQLRNRRWFGTPVMLPTGEVFLVNGGDADDVVAPGSAAAVRTPEIYDPRTGTWRTAAPASRDRVYHNSAVLLPDGRVLVGGNAPHPAYFLRHDNTLTRSNNFRDATFEIYEPPYLFRGPRPQLTAAVPVEGGRALSLALGAGTRAEDISEVVLVRLGANTHSMDADMRGVKLSHTASGERVLAQLPRGGDAGVLPPGPYYVFAMRATPGGPVPSIAKTVLVQPAGDGKVVARGM